jgi:hypothetical protein
MDNGWEQTGEQWYQYSSWWPENNNVPDPDPDDMVLQFQVMDDPCVDTPDNFWCISIFTKEPGNDVYEHVCTLPEVHWQVFARYNTDACNRLNNLCDFDQNLCNQEYYWRAVRNYYNDEILGKYVNTYRMFTVQQQNPSSDLQVFINDQYQFSNLSFANPIYVQEPGMKVEMRYQAPTSGEPNLDWRNLKIIPEKGHNPDDL